MDTRSGTARGQLRTLVELVRTPHQALLNLPRRFGPISTLGAGRLRYVFLLGPRANDFVLSNSGLFSWGKSFEALMVVNGGTALLLSDGEQHRPGTCSASCWPGPTSPRPRSSTR